MVHKLQTHPYDSILHPIPAMGCPKQISKPHDAVITVVAVGALDTRTTLHLSSLLVRHTTCHIVRVQQIVSLVAVGLLQEVLVQLLDERVLVAATNGGALIQGIHRSLAFLQQQEDHKHSRITSTQHMTIRGSSVYVGDCTQVVGDTTNSSSIRRGLTHGEPLWRRIQPT